jgi:hypothetical protein
VTERDKLIKIAKNEMASANRGNTLIEPRRTLQIDSIEISSRPVFFFFPYLQCHQENTHFLPYFSVISGTKVVSHARKKWQPETLMKDMEDAGMNN